MPEIPKDLYLFFSKGIEVAPRIIGQQDRNYLSPTYGYFGRKHWAWKTSGMPDASNQYALYYLAILWSLNEKDNPYYHNENILSWILAGINAWVKLQHRDGSFDQVFPNEHSVGATSYTLLAILETNKILGDRIMNDVKPGMLRSIARAAGFLLSNEETYGIISNHLALFAVTYHELWQFSGNKAYKDKSKKTIATILKYMSKEGWFKEYEGADPGYQTQCIYYLARLFEAGYDELEKPLGDAIRDYLPYFVHPDGSIGGHYGSRNTTIFYPGGVALLLPKYIEARKILLHLRGGIHNGTSPSPASLDFPNTVRLATNYLIAWKYLRESNSCGLDKNYLLPWERNNIWKELPGSGNLLVGTPCYYAIVGIKKGGVIKVFDKASGSLVCDDKGYLATAGNKSITTQAFYESGYEAAKNIIKIKRPFFITKLHKMTPGKQIIILFFGITIFRWKVLRETFKKILVNLLILDKKLTPISCEREIEFNDSNITVRDKIYVPKGKILKGLKSNLDFSSMHMASSDYFEAGNLCKREGVNIPRVDHSGRVVEYKLCFPVKKQYSGEK